MSLCVLHFVCSARTDRVEDISIKADACVAQCWEDHPGQVISNHGHNMLPSGKVT